MGNYFSGVVADFDFLNDNEFGVSLVRYQSMISAISTNFLGDCFRQSFSVLFLYHFYDFS